MLSLSLFETRTYYDIVIILENNDNTIWREYSNEIIAEYKAELIRSKLGSFEQIFPKDQNVLKKYSKYYKQPGDENILLWSWLINNYEN